MSAFTENIDVMSTILDWLGRKVPVACAVLRPRSGSRRRRNLADDPAYQVLVLEYAQRMLSWRMAPDERLSTNIDLTPDGPVEWDGPRRSLITQFKWHEFDCG